MDSCFASNTFFMGFPEFLAEGLLGLFEFESTRLGDADRELLGRHAMLAQNQAEAETKNCYCLTLLKRQKSCQEAAGNWWLPTRASQPTIGQRHLATGHGGRTVRTLES